jgi:hypothetical protein
MTGLLTLTTLESALDQTLLIAHSMPNWPHADPEDKYYSYERRLD